MTLALTLTLALPLTPKDAPGPKYDAPGTTTEPD